MALILGACYTAQMGAVDPKTKSVLLSQLRDKWPILASLLMHKVGRKEILITEDDARAFIGSNRHIVVEQRAGGLAFMLVTSKEADRREQLIAEARRASTSQPQEPPPEPPTGASKTSDDPAQESAPHTASDSPQASQTDH